MEQVCTRILNRMLHRSLDVAMMTWRDHVRKHHLARTVARHWMIRSVSSAFTTWKDNVNKANDDARKDRIGQCMERKRTRRALAASFILLRLAAAVSVIKNLHRGTYLKLPHLIEMGFTGDRARERRGKRSLSEQRISLRERQELMARIENGWMKHAQEYWKAAEYECKAAREWFLQMAALYDHLCKQVQHGTICPVCSCFEYDTRKCSSLHVCVPPLCNFLCEYTGTVWLRTPARSPLSVPHDPPPAPVHQAQRRVSIGRGQPHVFLHRKPRSVAYTLRDVCVCANRHKCIHHT
jgi:hypothetical protein